ncbi:unnamed protein product [Penicillium manginii]
MVTSIFLYLVHTGRLTTLAPYETLVQFTAAVSITLWLNDWLSVKSRNNWVIDDTWDWKKEVIVVTGGSGGIGAGVSQRLADMGAKVIVLDIIPLTFKPGTKRIVYRKCDLSDEKEIANVCENIRNEEGHPTVLGQ